MKSRSIVALFSASMLIASCTHDHSSTTALPEQAAHSHQHEASTGVPAVARAVTSSLGSIGFVCAWSHRNSDDPIVHPAMPGASHTHEYFGAEQVDATTNWEQLASLPNTCESDSDYSAYWVPSLLVDDSRVQPSNMAVYLRVPDSARPESVTVPPNGLELVSVRSGWTCARTDVPSTSWQRCPHTASTRLILEYPDCWNGEDLRSPSHFAHVAVSIDGSCPASHPVVLPQFVTEVRYDLQGLPTSATPRLSSGPLSGAHGDMILSWDRSKLKRDIDACLLRSITCDLTWSTGLGT